MAQPAVGSVVETLRQRILDGAMAPGDRLDEVRLGGELEVSRNTLREAFRVLEHEHVIEHRPHRGVFVRRLTAREAREVYAMRRLVEPGALREAAVRRLAAQQLPTAEQGPFERAWERAVSEVVRAVGQGQSGVRAGDFGAVGTANGRFHLAVAALSGNDVIVRTVRQLLTEMRLLFLVADSARDVHARYVEDNRRIADLIVAGELVRASVAMEDYLFRAERHLLSDC
ncbi:GntR family transcriptional regulator [Calidifontibacter sp. DB0510]|uniref:GntR family transcriptional regulator n=1 Tax=Metallococcus carri TaxID=1656884 RepID=A0A967B679_9MICO|nr:GntR family transcriptional regulator [Metallococcus carri]NHN56337.1 GntR family transcriptional regulator [Metallococcus carri]NOP35961.1 GntR family transcriptional regulator [Calidifontibacter sp. DB2511S]